VRPDRDPVSGGERDVRGVLVGVDIGSWVALEDNGDGRSGDMVVTVMRERGAWMRWIVFSNGVLSISYGCGATYGQRRYPI
jgi:hypothetical protein